MLRLEKSTSYFLRDDDLTTKTHVKSYLKKSLHTCCSAICGRVGISSEKEKYRLENVLYCKK
jgi:hypothetical protein